MSASRWFADDAGLAFFYGGLSRGKSVLNMMMMSFGTMGVIGIVYVLWGFSMSFWQRDQGRLGYLGCSPIPSGSSGSNQLMTKGSRQATHVVPVGQHSGDRLLVFQLTFFAVISVALIQWCAR